MELVMLEHSENLNSGEETFTAIIQIDGETKTIMMESSHPSFKKIEEVVRDFQDGVLLPEEVAELFVQFSDLAGTTEKKIEKITKINGSSMGGRMTVSDGRVLIDYEPIDPTLEAHILRMLQEDGTPKDELNWSSFVKFVENLYNNQTPYIREQLFGWMQYENLHGHGFTLTPDGCFIGYKGCSGEVSDPVSINTGFAIVDGVSMNGHIPNRPGSVVEMPRSMVEDNPSVGCASGLHVGTYDYAKNWSNGVLLTVKVNPRDVVSVPLECDSQKIRTCRYTVVEAVEGPIKETTWEEDLDCECESGLDAHFCDCDDFCDCNDFCDCYDFYNYCVCGHGYDPTRSQHDDNDDDDEVENEEKDWSPGWCYDCDNDIRDCACEEQDDVDRRAKRCQDCKKYFCVCPWLDKDSLDNRDTLRDLAVKVSDYAKNFIKRDKDEGLSLIFDYIDRNGVKTTDREVVVKEFDGSKIVGDTLKGVRSFFIDKISNARILNPDSSDNAATTDDEVVEESPASESPKNAEKHSMETLINDLKFAIDRDIDLNITLEDGNKVKGSPIEIVGDLFVLVNTGSSAVVVDIRKISDIFNNH